jgi:hypothetical protein
MAPSPAPNAVQNPATNETTPLLAASAAGPTAQANEEAVVNETHPTDGDDDKDRPLPKLQIFLLCYARLVEPIAFFSIFPFINLMIFETGNLDESDVGFYSGLIVRSFLFAHVFVAIFC